MALSKKATLVTIIGAAAGVAAAMDPVGNIRDLVDPVAVYGKADQLPNATTYAVEYATMMGALAYGAYHVIRDKTRLTGRMAATAIIGAYAGLDLLIQTLTESKWDLRDAFHPLDTIAQKGPYHGAPNYIVPLVTSYAAAIATAWNAFRGKFFGPQRAAPAAPLAVAPAPVLPAVPPAPHVPPAPGGPGLPTP